MDNSGNVLSPSPYQPSESVKKLFAKVQRDYQIAYSLMHRGFDEFDGLSPLQRAKVDQETFGAFVGAQYIPQHKKWRWVGRKNTSRNKLMTIAAHMLAGMLFPYVYAQNDKNEEDKMTARVMRILVEDHLKKARYETKFLYMLLSALVNPAVYCGVEYVVAMQKIKQKLKEGKIKVVDAIDEMMTGINLNVTPFDEIFPLDVYSGTGDLQRIDFLRVRRISWDEAQKTNGDNPNFKYVRAGQTKIVVGQEQQTLYDVAWTEADANYVQEITAYYRSEDSELKWIGGVFMGNEENPYNSNRFKHRRMTKIGDEWISMPVSPYCMSGFEPLDPTGRFLFYKSGAFKEYWDDKGLNRAHQLLFDGMQLDVIKPQFISGIAKSDSQTLAPGAVIAMPAGSKAEMYSLSPNISAAFQVLQQEKQDMSESTQDQTQGGVAQPNVTARATMIAQRNARVFLGIFGVMIADLVRQVGELAMDCIIQHTTVGEIDASIPESLNMKYKTIMAKSKDKGKDVTNRIQFDSNMMGKEQSRKDMEEMEWALFNEAGGMDTDQRIYKVNPYKFARTKFGMSVDADEIVSYAMGTKDQKDQLAFQMLSLPNVAPFTDQKAVVDDFVIDKYGGSDPDKYKKVPDPQQEMLDSVMGTGQGRPTPSPVQQSNLPDLNKMSV